MREYTFNNFKVLATMQGTIVAYRPKGHDFSVAWASGSTFVNDRGEAEDLLLKLVAKGEFEDLEHTRVG